MNDFAKVLEQAGGNRLLFDSSCVLYPRIPKPEQVERLKRFGIGLYVPKGGEFELIISPGDDPRYRGLGSKIKRNWDENRAGRPMTPKEIPEDYDREKVEALRPTYEWVKTVEKTESFPYKLEVFLKSLADFEAGDSVQNQYSEQRHTIVNLRNYLAKIRRRRNPPNLFVGEAPGYLGCCRTGIPFTDWEQILRSKHQFLASIQKRMFLAPPLDPPEPTAGIFWNFFTKNKLEIPLMWNAFPFHPHEAGDPNSNRKPTTEEISLGQAFLANLAALFSPARLIAIGRVGERSLRETFPGQAVTYIRHPSFGGKRAFEEGMARVFKLSLPQVTTLDCFKKKPTKEGK